MFLSIMGMYEYDTDVFEGLEAPLYTDPDGNDHIVDRYNIIQNIVLNCAELELIYPSIDMMKRAIAVWSAAELDTWNKLYATQVISYNPIWNVDANIIETEAGTENRDIDRTGTGSNNRTVTQTDNRTVNLSDKRSVKGFNADTWAEAEKTDHTGTDNTSASTTDNTALTSSDVVNDDVSRNRTLTARRTGNIGVTATQDLIKKEREIAEFNIIDYITESFKKRFCLMVY